MPPGMAQPCDGPWSDRDESDDMVCLLSGLLHGTHTPACRRRCDNEKISVAATWHELAVRHAVVM